MTTRLLAPEEAQKITSKVGRKLWRGLRALHESEDVVEDSAGAALREIWRWTSAIERIISSVWKLLIYSHKTLKRRAAGHTSSVWLLRTSLGCDKRKETSRGCWKREEKVLNKISINILKVCHRGATSCRCWRMMHKHNVVFFNHPGTTKHVAGGNAQTFRCESSVKQQHLLYNA